MNWMRRNGENDRGSKRDWPWSTEFVPTNNKQLTYTNLQDTKKNTTKQCNTYKEYVLALWSADDFVHIQRVKQVIKPFHMWLHASFQSWCTFCLCLCVRVCLCVHLQSISFHLNDQRPITMTFIHCSVQFSWMNYFFLSFSHHRLFLQLHAMQFLFLIYAIFVFPLVFSLFFFLDRLISLIKYLSILDRP